MARRRTWTRSGRKPSEERSSESAARPPGHTSVKERGSREIAQGARSLSPGWEQPVDNSGGDVGWQRELHPSPEGERFRPRVGWGDRFTERRHLGCSALQTASRWSGDARPSAAPPRNLSRKRAGRGGDTVRILLEWWGVRGGTGTWRLPPPGAPGTIGFRAGSQGRARSLPPSLLQSCDTRCPSGSGRGSANVRGSKGPRTQRATTRVGAPLSRESSTGDARDGLRLCANAATTRPRQS